MDVCIYKLSRMLIFSILNANSGYLRVEIEEPDRKKRLTSQNALYRFVRMRFALKNKPEIFQRSTKVIPFSGR